MKGLISHAKVISCKASLVVKSQAYSESGIIASMDQVIIDKSAGPLVVWHLPEDGSHKNAYGRLMTSNLEQIGVRIVPIPYSHLFSRRAFRNKPDLVHFQSITPFLLPALAPDSVVRAIVKGNLFLLQVLFLRLAGCRIVWTVHNLVNHEKRLARLERFFSIIFTRMANVIITHGESAKRSVVKAFRLDRKIHKISVLFHPNYIDAYPNEIDQNRARRQLGIRRNSRVLLCLGQIRPYKGLPELVAAFRQVWQADLELWIVGEVVDPELAQQLQQVSEFDHGVCFRPGHVPDDQMQVYLNACDSMVLSYRSILTSGAALLAISFGKSCIAPRMGSLVEVLDDKGAFLYDPNDADGLKNALLEVRKSTTEDLNRMGHHNFDRAQKWGWPEAANRLAAFYKAAMTNVIT